MTKRILTAGVLILLVLLVLAGPRWLFFLGVLPVGLLALWEYLELVGRTGGAPMRSPLYLVGLGVWLVASWFPGHLLPAIIGGSLVLLVGNALGREQRAESLSASATSTFGLLYIVVPFALLLDLRSAGPQVVLYLLLLVWVGDTAAYFVGRAIGQHKLAPSLSPGKTVEGTVASLVATLGLGFWLFDAWFGSFGTVHALLLPLVVNLVAQGGDLAESALKRSAGVKDSSALLPGHGGILDRVDSLLFAVPALWYYWKLLAWGPF